MKRNSETTDQETEAKIAKTESIKLTDFLAKPVDEKDPYGHRKNVAELIQHLMAQGIGKFEFDYLSWAYFVPRDFWVEQMGEDVATLYPGYFAVKNEQGEFDINEFDAIVDDKEEDEITLLFTSDIGNEIMHALCGEDTSEIIQDIVEILKKHNSMTLEDIDEEEDDDDEKYAVIGYDEWFDMTQIPKDIVAFCGNTLRDELIERKKLVYSFQKVMWPSDDGKQVFLKPVNLEMASA